MSYFLIRSDEDGTTVEKVTKQQLLKYIQPDKHGEFYFGEELVFLEAVPPSDKGYWHNCPDNSAILIKGEIIVPKLKQVVTKYDIED